MTTNGNQRGDDELVLALARGESVKDAAREAGIGERTAHRRLRARPDLRQRVAALRDELWQAAVGSLADAASEAVATLRELLGSDSDTVRLGAARAILDLGNQLRTATELETRISELEQKTDATQPTQAA